MKNKVQNKVCIARPRLVFREHKITIIMLCLHYYKAYVNFKMGVFSMLKIGNNE